MSQEKILGLSRPLAVAARAGSRPKVEPRALVRPMGVLLLIMGACAAVAGVMGYLLARGGVVFLFGQLAARVPRERHAVFLADLWAHNASYLVGLSGGSC